MRTDAERFFVAMNFGPCKGSPIPRIPWGTKIEVKHLASGKTITVTLIDLGPARGTGNAIDLTPAAFKQFASLSVGKVMLAAAQSPPEGFSALFQSSLTADNDSNDDCDLLTVEDGVGIVPIQGPMVRQPDLISRFLFGATDIEEITNAVNTAAERPDIQAILLDIDSPGGSVNGTPELAQAVSDLCKSKYTYAFSGGQMCSAAYWVASQRDAIYITPSARVGSIGVILPVVDSTEAYNQAGLHAQGVRAR